MIVKLILDQAILHKGVGIDSVYGKRWINEAIDELSTKYDSACVKTTASITCSDILDEYALPIGCKGVRQVFDDSKIKYDDFTVDMGYIRLGDKGTYTVQYLLIPKNILTDSEVPEINENYHMIIALFVASRELKRVNKLDPKADGLMAEFQIKSESANIRLMNMKRGSKKLPSRAWN